MMSAGAKLERQVFTTSRDLEYFSESELEKQTGYAREDWWPGVIVKELVDNALDACESAGIAPDITVAVGEDEITVSDNGPGLPADVISRILDFSTKTTDKAAYVSPTRGAQGNALKTVLAIPYVLNDQNTAVVEIRARGQRHEITVSTFNRRPRIECASEEIVKTEGTSVRVTRDSACSEDEPPNPGFLQKLLLGYALFNPHASFTVKRSAAGPDIYSFKASNTAWRKWTPSDPTPARWYNVEQLEELAGSYIAAGETGGPARTVREFVKDFRGLSGTAKQKQVASEAGLERLRLQDLLGADGRLDQSALRRLLNVMQKASAPVKPEALGVLGEEHFRQQFESSRTAGKSFCYKRVSGFDGDDLPFVVECAFVMTTVPSLMGKHIGLNWSVPLTDPLQDIEFSIEGDGCSWGLSGLLAKHRIEPWDGASGDKIALALHLIHPRFNFLDRGKGSVGLDDAVSAAVAKAVLHTTKKWADFKKKLERNRRQANREMDRLTKDTSRVSIKEAAFAVMAEAYRKTAGDMNMARARQIMYSARPAIQEATGESLDQNYFTQTLLPDYQTEHPEETADWDVVYDERGHLIEPHTGHQIGIGTLRVREYMASHISSVGLSLPELPGGFPTRGPRNRFATVLFVEKEGFNPLMQRAGFPERYDMAIMSSKGMGSTSARSLIEGLANSGVKILVLHDFDKSGFSIAGTLTRDTRRYSFASQIEVIDLGLRLEDVREWKLQDEEHDHQSDPTENLRLNGATDEEIEFLRGKRVDSKKVKYSGRRVELNAFTSPQFVEWLDRKLEEHGVKKVIPDQATLEQAYRRASALDSYRAVLKSALDEVESAADALDVPTDLQSRVAAHLAAHPSQSWDDAVEWLLLAEEK